MQEVHLTGLNVANFGTIATGVGGVVTMTWGKDVSIGTVSSPASHPLVMVKVSSAGATQANGTGVVNAGSVRAPGGQVQLGAGDLFAAGIYNSGTIAGSDVTVDSGKGTNISTGTIDASSATGKGGRVEMLGQGVEVTGTVDASGATGGGDVRIGGDFHGGGSLPTSAKAIVTGRIVADATGEGDGGTVVVWSDVHTVFTGTLSAAGAGVGTGGSAEVSSHGVLDFSPVAVNLGGAGGGGNGSLLLDPLTITIQDSNPDINGDGTTGDDITHNNDLDNANGKETGANSIITSTALNSLMNGGGSSDVNLAAVTSISVDTSTVQINTGTHHLQLDAPTINLADAITGTVQIGGTVTTIHVTGGTANLSQAVGFTPNNKTLIIEGGTYTGTGAVTIASNITVTANGTVVADAWSTSAGKSVTMSGGFQSAGNIALAANTTLNGTLLLNGGNIAISGPVTGSGNTLQLISAGDETITTTIALGTGIFSCQGANFSLSSGVIGANNITLTQSGNINLTGNLTAGSGPAGFVTLASGGNVTTVGISGTNVSVTSNAGAAGTVTLGTINASTQFVASADGDVSQTAATTISSGNVAMTSANGNVTLGGTSVSASSGNMTLGAGLAISGANVTAGNLTATAGTTINLTGGQVNTFTGTSHGTMTFTNAGGLTVVSATSNGNDIALSDTTGAVIVSGNVTAGAGNVTVTGQTNLTNSATVSGASVTLTATTGSILGTGNVTASTGNATLTAATDITTTSGTISGTNVLLTATAGNITGSGNITAGTGNANLTAGGNIANAGGAVSGTSVLVTSTGAGITISENYTATAGNVTLTAQTSIGGTGGTVSGSNVTLTATTGGISGSANITAGSGNAALTAAGDITVSGVAVSGAAVTVTSTGGGITVGENYTATTGNATLTAQTNITSGGGVVSGANVLLTATTGGIGASGQAVQFTTGGNLVLLSGGSAHAGDIFVTTAGAVSTSKVLPGNATFFTDAGSVQVVSVASTGGAMTVDTAFSSPNTAGNDDVTLAGTTVAVNAPVTGGTVGLTSTSGGISWTSGFTANTLNVNSAGTINLAATVVGTLNATANGAITFTNAGGLAAGNIASNGNNISLHDTTGAVSIAGTVTAGAANATIEASTSITEGGGSVTGGVVTLTADTGDIGTSGTHVQTSSGGAAADLVLTGGNIFVTEAHAIDTTNVTATIGAGDTLALTAPTIALTSALVNDTTATVVLTSTAGSITGTTGSVSAANVTLASAAGINVANVTATTNLTMSAVGAAITLTEGSGNLELGIVHIAGTPTDVTLKSPLISVTTAAFSAGGANLTLEATAGTLTMTQDISAQNIVLKTDGLVAIAGGLKAPTGNVTVTTETAGTPISVGAAAGIMNVSQTLLQNSTAVNFTIGGPGASSTIAVGTTNLVATTYNLVLQTTGQVSFTGGGTLTLGNDKTLTFNGAGGIVDGGSNPAIQIGGTSGTVNFVNMSGDIGAHVAPLLTEVSVLGGVSGAGTVYLSNIGGLTVSGVVNPAGGNGDGFIEVHSPLTVTSNITVSGGFALTATGGDLTITGATVTSTNGGELDLSAGGNITLDVGSGVVTSGGVANMTAGGFITTNGPTPVVTAGTLNASAATGISLNSNGITVGNFSATNTTSGEIVFQDQGSVSITGISQSGGGNVSLTVLGHANQTGATSGITTGGGNLVVQTRSAGGAAGTIVLTNAGNNLGTGLATLQVRDAGGGTTVSSDVQFTTAGAMHLQQVDAGTAGNVTLAGTTIDQAADPVGIRGNVLTVVSAGDVTLTSANNTFKALSADDTSGTGHLSFVTSAAGGLTLTGLTNVNTANITNQTGAISGNVSLAAANLTLTATGGISLSNTSNAIGIIQLFNSTSGAINVQDGTSLTVRGSTQNAISNSTTFNVGGDLTFTGDVAAGNGFTATAGATHAISTVTANITANGSIAMKADIWALDPTRTVTGTTVTLTSVSAAHAIALDGSTVGAGLSNGELDSIHATNLVLGDSGLTGGIASGASAVSFGANVSGNLTFVSAGGISLAASNFTTNGAAAVSMQHTGTLTLANGTFGGTFTESAIGGSGAGGTTQLSGLIQTTNKTVTFNSVVQLTGSGASVSTVGTTGAAITFGFSGAASVTGTTAAGQNLTLTAGTSAIVFTSPVGTAGTPLGTLTVNSVGTLNLPTVFAVGEHITHSGVLTVSGVQTLGSGGFTEGGTGSVALGANIASTGGANTFNSPAALGTNLSITGTTTTFTGTLTGNSHDLTVNGNGAFATVNGIGNVVVTGNGTFATIAGATSVLVDGNGTFGTMTSVGSVHVVGNGTFNGLLSAGTATVDGNGSFNNVTLTGALQTGGTALFNAPVSASSVSVGGLATVATASITTTTTQIYSGGMTLNSDATLSGTTVTIGGTLTGNGHNLAIGNDAVLGTVTGTGILHVLRDATFGGTVNTGTLQVDNNEIVNTSSITSSGTQTVNGVTILGTSTTLTGTTITLANGVTGNGHDLTLGQDAVLGAVSGTGNLHVLGNGTFNGAVTTGTLTVDGIETVNTNSITSTGNQLVSGSVVLGTDTTFTGASLVFGNAITGNGHNVTVNGNATFGLILNTGAVHVVGSALFASGVLSAGSILVDGTTVVGTDQITTSGSQTYNGTLTLNHSVVMTGSALTFEGAVTGNSFDLTLAGNSAFQGVSGVGTLHGLAAVTFSGTVSAGNVAVDGASAINTANITTTGTQLYLGTATLGTSAVLTGSSVTFGSTLTGTTHDLIVHGDGTFSAIASLGNLSVSGVGTFGGNVAAGSVLIGGNSFVTAHSITTTGTQTYTGGMTAGADLALSGSTVTFGGTLATGSSNVTVNGTGVFNAVNGTGSLVVNGPATFGGSISEGALAVSGTTAINTANITTTGAQTYTGTTTLGQTAALSGSTVTFGTLEGGGNDLTVNGAGTFGTVATIRNLTVNGAGTFDKAVTATGLVKVTGAGSFSAAVNAESLTVDGAATLLQNVTTSGDQTYNGRLTVNLASRDITLQTTGTVPAGANGSISINSGLDGSGSGVLTLQTGKPAQGLIVSDTSHAMKIAGAVNLGAGTLNIVNGGVVQFAPVGGAGETVNAAKISFALPDGQKAPDQIVATIFDKTSDLTFNAGAGGFFMGHGETMTVFNPAGGGSLKITSTTGNITLGDLTALGDITVDSGGRDIAFQAHGNITLPDNLNAPNRFTQTTGVVSGGNVTINGKLTIPQTNVPVPPPLGFKNEVWFSVLNPEKLHLSATQVTQQSANGSTATGQFFSFSQTTALSTTQLEDAGLVLYAPADGSAPAFALQSSIPRDVQTLQPERAATVAGTMLEDLQHLGVNARAANKDELLAYLLGDAIYNDIPTTLTPAYEDMRVAANRLPNSPILPTVSAYRALFFEPVVDANGATVNNPDGTPKMVNRREKIQAAFELAWDAYTTDEPKGAPEGLRAYLESKKSDPNMATALDYLNKMRTLLGQIRSLGLTDTEFSLSKGVLFRQVQPQNIASSDAFLSAIMGTTQTVKQSAPATPKTEASEENSLKNVTAMK